MQPSFSPSAEQRYLCTSAKGHLVLLEPLVWQKLSLFPLAEALTNASLLFSIGRAEISPYFCKGSCPLSVPEPSMTQAVTRDASRKTVVCLRVDLGKREIRDIKHRLSG